MNLQELARSFPNGLHDATVYSIVLDYEKREAILDLDVWIGDLDSGDELVREAYRRGKLALSGLVYCVIEPPDARYQFETCDSLTIDTGAMAELKKQPSCILPTVPEGAFISWIFVQEWNAFMYFAAKDAQIVWKP